MMLKCEQVQEQAVVFGAHDHLVGVLRHPHTSTLAGDGEAAAPLMVLMLNAGMLHSTGPFRLHVDLARALGKAGIGSLRFDVSGIGESLPVAAGGTSLERVATEVTAALDFLTVNIGARRFALFGLCAGADDALYAALQDERIEAIFAVDGLGYRTPGFYWHRLWSQYLPAARNPRKWQRWLSKRLGHAPVAPPSLQFGGDIREFPARDEASRQLQQLLERGVRMHFHYSGGVGSYYNYAAQFRDMFPELFAGRWAGRALLSTSFHPEADHVCFLCEHRAELVRLATKTLVEFQRAS